MRGRVKDIEKKIVSENIEMIEDIIVDVRRKVKSEIIDNCRKRDR